MKIYPKTNKYFEGLDSLMEYVEKDKGIEIQFFNEHGPMSSFEIKSVIDETLKRIPDIKEITIHPPLVNYEIEDVLMKDKTIIENQLKDICELSQKYDITINMLYHTEQNIIKAREILIPWLKRLLKIIEGKKVRILIENLFMFFEDKCSVLEIAKEIDNPQLRVCIDVCHLYCNAHIYKKSIEEFLDGYMLDKDICKKYVYQVHFATALNNDGYIDHKTHGRKHENYESLVHDYNLMKKYGLDDCNYVVEVSENDYVKRPDQIEEIKMLNKAIKEIK